MRPSCDRVFQIAELAHEITAYLDKRSLVRLMSTCRLIHTACEPSLYNTLDIYDKPYISHRIRTLASLTALARNSHHIRHLKTGLVFSTYLYGALRAYQESQQQCVEGSSALSSLELERPFCCDDDIELLAKTIARASSLEQLSLQLVRAYQFDGSKLRQTIFFSAPTSLQQLRINELEAEELDHNRESLLNKRSRNEWWKYRLGRADMTPQRRQRPLPNLLELDLFTEALGRESVENIKSMLEHCPALRSFTAPCIEDDADVGSLAEHVAKYCPRIRKLTYRQDRELSTANKAFIFAFMNVLPEQIMESIRCMSFDERELGTDAANSFRRHSLTLRTIDLMGCDEIQSGTVRTILQECRALEDLLIWNVAPLGCCYVDLEDAVAAIPWACTRIKDLRLVVKIHELYRTMGEHEEYEDDELRPYYERPAPVYLTDFEKQQFSLLERFFRQIGGLLDLEVLALRAEVIPEGFEENDGMWGMDTYPGESFPALLSLGDQETGRPGFLGLFGGLTKLRRLSGSIEVNDKENSVIMGWNEARWLAEHLPSLEEAEFYNVYSPFDLPTQISPYMRWLTEQRPTLRIWRSFT
ncbi:hypothetical protein BG015_002151 [Linnemannia schmuckeri]|uniref:F-box domain-containing protein n=1 Tax=Linnemannia schmuckeri TaxID=64567 RepID=A0A9P5RPD9_9FUNG|nr:hypothetical protein BG015_002151 [Linnemannia schmuckeri]